MKWLTDMQSVFVIFTLAYSCFSESQSPDVQRIKCATTHYPPFAIYQQKTGKFVGRDLDILRSLEEKFNWQFKVDNLPWGRVNVEIEKDNYDCFFAMAYEDRRAEHLDYTQYPLHVTRYGVFHKNTNYNVTDKNFSGLSIGLLRGIPLAPPVLEMYDLASANIVYLGSNEIMLSMVELGRIDAAITNYDVGNYVLTEMEEQTDIVSFVIEGYRLPVFLVFKKDQQDIDKINQELSTLITDP